MYHYITDKEFLKRARGLCSNLVNQLVRRINKDSFMTVEAHLVGSGARNLVTQNGEEPIDFDYNLCIISTNGLYIQDCRAIKEYIRKQLNVVLRENGWGDCMDSTTALTTQKQWLKTGNRTAFSIDIAIVRECESKWYRLVHKKTGDAKRDEYFWREAPKSQGLRKKVDKLKQHGFWLAVREAYLKKKNMYLSRRDKNHPSFNVYIEAVHEIYHSKFH